MDDLKIWAALEPLFPSELEDLPMDGDWLQPPFNNDSGGRAIVCNDDDFQFVVVDRKTGRVLFVCEDDESVVASDLEKFTHVVRAWDAIDRDTVGPEDDAGFTEVKKSFEDQLKLIDRKAAGSNEFWQLYTDELTSEDYSEPNEKSDVRDDDERKPDTGDNDRPAMAVNS